MPQPVGIAQPGQLDIVKRPDLLVPSPSEYSYSPSAEATQLASKRDANGRTWYSFVPAGDTAAPVVLLLHGAGRDGLSMIDMWKDVAKTHDMVLIAPNSMAQIWDKSELSATLVDKMLSDASKSRAIDGGNVFLFGHSNGATYAAYLLNRRVGPWRAAALHGGFGPSETYVPAADPKPIRIYLGTQDHIFGVTAARRSAVSLSKSGHRTDLHLIPGHSHWFYAIGPKIAQDSWEWLQTTRTFD
ncbi:MAG: dienelactone hydrolase family protein [Pseudomonadota bacterium]